MAFQRQRQVGFFACEGEINALPVAVLRSVLKNSINEFERRLTVKLFDSNRTLSSMRDSVRKEVEIDSVEELVIRLCFGDWLPEQGGFARNIRCLAQLTSFLPPHSLLRLHGAGDFSVVAPLELCTRDYNPRSRVLTPDWQTGSFTAARGEVFVPLRTFKNDRNFVEVFSPYPGSHDEIDEEAYEETTLRIGGATDADALYLPPQRVEEKLLHVKKGKDVAMIKSGVLLEGDHIIVRGHSHRVTLVLPYYGAENVDMPSFAPPFSFNGASVVVHVERQIRVRGKYGLIPRDHLQVHEPVSVSYRSRHNAHGTFKLVFSNLAFTPTLRSHRNTFTYMPAVLAEEPK